MHAAEGYLLGDLTAAEHEAFEEHFADCDTCFADVRDGAQLTTVLRNEVAKEPLPVPRFNLRVAFVAAASVVLSIGGLAYQQVAVVVPLRAQLAKEREPRITPLLALNDSRGAEELVNVDGRSRFLFEFVIPPDVDSPPYTCKIIDAHGQTRVVVPVTAEQARQPVDLLMPPGRLAPGDYSLIVSGTGGVSAFEKRFTVR